MPLTQSRQILHDRRRLGVLCDLQQGKAPQTAELLNEVHFRVVHVIEHVGLTGHQLPLVGEAELSVHLRRA